MRDSACGIGHEKVAAFVDAGVCDLDKACLLLGDRDGMRMGGDRRGTAHDAYDELACEVVVSAADSCVVGLDLESVPVVVLERGDAHGELGDVDPFLVHDGVSFLLRI